MASARLVDSRWHAPRLCGLEFGKVVRFDLWAVGQGFVCEVYKLDRSKRDGAGESVAGEICFPHTPEFRWYGCKKAVRELAKWSACQRAIWCALDAGIIEIDTGRMWP